LYEIIPNNAAEIIRHRFSVDLIGPLIEWRWCDLTHLEIDGLVSEFYTAVTIEKMKTLIKNPKRWLIS
jgi:hypothetical protein